MLKFSVTKKSDKSPEEILSKINTLDKLLSHEKEIKEAHLLKGNKKRGVAWVRVQIFGQEIKGKMRYEIKNGKSERQFGE